MLGHWAILCNNRPARSNSTVQLFLAHSNRGVSFYRTQQARYFMIGDRSNAD
jgi:hypothetical protein